MNIMSSGPALYTFAHDKEGQSTCNGECAKTWPPLIASAEATRVGDWTPIERTDAIRQWAYKGRPVYTHAQDEAGKSTNVGADGAWHLVEP
jgi:predicted lipoprotein with Yx(FWY)xxD motif